MPDDRPESGNNFQALLDWLDADRDSAGRKYERIRCALIRIFASRGCHEAESLADATIDRVGARVAAIAPEFEGEPAKYFYGVANKMHFEWLRKHRRLAEVELDEQTAQLPEEDKASDDRIACLESCLEKLRPESKTIILRYYSVEKGNKIVNRHALAGSIGISQEALHTRVSRLRTKLHQCVKKCLSNTK